MRWGQEGGSVSIYFNKKKKKKKKNKTTLFCERKMPAFKLQVQESGHKL